MNFAFSVFLFFVVLTANAQKIYFPAQNTKDSVTLTASIPLLASQLLDQINEAGEENTLYHKFLFQLAAKDYEGSNNTIYTLRKLYAKSDTTGVNGFALQSETYNLSKLLQKDNMTFQQIFDSIYTIKYSRLNKSEKREAGEVAESTPAKSLQNLSDIISKLNSTDSLSYKDAKQLVENYLRYQVVKQTDSFIQEFYAAHERAVYNFRDVLITMRDGSQVEALIGTMDTSSKMPAIMKFNIYIDISQAKYDIKRWADNGYVGIVAFTRGKGKSPQEIEPYEHDADDAYDVIDWLSKQPYCNGKVGMMGGSYLGFSQWAAAKKIHPALKSIMPQVAVAPGIDYPFFHGIGMTQMLKWIHYTTNSKETDYEDHNDTTHWNAVFKKWYVTGAAFKALDTVEGRPSKIFQRWMQHPYHDSFWKNMTSYEQDFSQINIPVLTTTGYYDDEQSGALYYVNQYYLNNKNANHYLIIGPYDHGSAQNGQGESLNGYTIDSVARIYFPDFAIKWFDYTLKDSARPAILKDRVNYEVMGANVWKNAPSLAAMSNDTLTFYLSGKQANGTYTISDVSSPKTFVSSTVNFTDRTDTIDINRMLGAESTRIIDSVLQYRNSLVFATQPFDAPLIINNCFYGELKVMINKKDMDVAIYMYEQMPDGKYFSLGSYMQRASLAKDKRKRQLLNPNKMETIPVTWSYMTAKQLQKGSRLIFVVGVNKNSQTEINYGTGKLVSSETIADAGKPLNIKWFGDSFIKVPIWK